MRVWGWLRVAGSLREPPRATRPSTPSGARRSLGCSEPEATFADRRGRVTTHLPRLLAPVRDTNRSGRWSSTSATASAVRADPALLLWLGDVRRGPPGAASESSASTSASRSRSPSITNPSPSAPSELHRGALTIAVPIVPSGRRRACCPFPALETCNSVSPEPSQAPDTFPPLFSWWIRTTVSGRRALPEVTNQLHEGVDLLERARCVHPKPASVAPRSPRQSRAPRRWLLAVRANPPRPANSPTGCSNTRSRSPTSPPAHASALR